MEDDCFVSELGEVNTLPSKQPSILDKIRDLIQIFLMLSIIIMVALSIIYFYNSIFWKPYDDASNHLLTKDNYWDSINCEGNTCTINFDSNVSDVSGVALTGSMIPVVNGNDIIICLNTTPKPGEIISVGNILHMVYKIEDGWITTRGFNNEWSDNFKFPISQVNCVVGLVVR